MSKRIFTIEHVVHFVMICFAASSLGNCAAFLIGAGHPWPSAWLLSGALGIGLTALSIMLTGIDKDGDSATFGTILAAACALGVLSGALQSAEYHKHLSMAWSLFLGFLSPLAGEVGLAWASSLYAKANKRRRFASIGADLEASVADVMVDAMRDVDRGAVQRRVDRVLNQMAGLAIDSAATKAMALYVKQPAQLDAPAQELLTPPTPEITPLTPTVNGGGEDFRQKMAEGKRKKAAERQRALYDILRAEFNGMDSEGLNKTALGERLGCTRQTISTDIEALTAQGLVTVNGVVSVA